jgi:serine protease Do
LPRIVATTPVGKAVPVILFRKGKEESKQVTLGRLEDGEKLASATAPEPATAPAATTRRVLGMELQPLNADARKRHSIKDGIKGVVVGRVDPESNAATKRLQTGDVIVEVGQEPEVADRVEKLKKDGRKSALLLVANAQGELRFVAVTIE